MTLLVFVVAVAAGVIGPLCIKALIAQGMGYQEVIFWRSVIAIMLVSPLALIRRSELRVAIAPIGALRMVIGGIVLSLSIFAYGTLSATEVTMFSRFDMPIFLMLFATGSQRNASIGVVALGLAYSYVPIVGGHASGVLAVWVATALTAISYNLIRKTAKANSVMALVWPPYIGAALCSLAIAGHVPKTPPLALLPYLAGTAMCAVALYVLSAELFKRSRLGAAELTGCLALLLTYFIEGAFTGTAPSRTVGTAAAVSTFLGLMLVFWEEAPKWLKKPSLQQ